MSMIDGIELDVLQEKAAAMDQLIALVDKYGEVVLCKLRVSRYGIFVNNLDETTDTLLIAIQKAYNSLKEYDRRS